LGAPACSRIPKFRRATIADRRGAQSGAGCHGRYQYVVRGAQKSLAELRTIQDVRYGIAKSEKETTRNRRQNAYSYAAYDLAR
jgi:hypothetical protein